LALSHLATTVQHDLRVGPGVVEELILVLVYGGGATLWMFLVIRDVVRARRTASVPVSYLWVFVALMFPLGSLAWVIYRRTLTRVSAG